MALVTLVVGGGWCSSLRCCGVGVDLWYVIVLTYYSLGFYVGFPFLLVCWMVSVDLVSVFAVVVVIVVWSAAVLCAVEIVLFELHTEALMGCLCAIDMSLSTTLGGVMCLYSR